MDDPLAKFFHYRLLDGRLMGSEHPTALGTHKTLVPHVVDHLGCRAMITLTTGFIDYAHPLLAQHHVPIEGVPTEAQLRRAHGWIEQHLNAGEPVWVHCQHGLDRTGVVLGTWLAREGMPSDDVLALLLDHFPERRRHPRFIEAWAPYQALIRQFAGEPPEPPTAPPWWRRLLRKR